MFFYLVNVFVYFAIDCQPSLNHKSKTVSKVLKIIFSAFRRETVKKTFAWLFACHDQ